MSDQKLVPVEPTDRMCTAAIKASLEHPGVLNGVYVYKAMLAAAPPEQAEIQELTLCESRHLTLREGVLYRFSVVAGCKECENLKLAYSNDQAEQAEQAGRYRESEDLLRWRYNEQAEQKAAAAQDGSQVTPTGMPAPAAAPCTDPNCPDERKYGSVHPAPIGEYSRTDIPLPTPASETPNSNEFEVWWESQDTEGLSSACKFSAWNAWIAASNARLSTQSNSAPAPAAPLPQTPRTDEFQRNTPMDFRHYSKLTEFARQLERELSALQGDIGSLVRYIHRHPAEHRGFDCALSDFTLKELTK